MQVGEGVGSLRRVSECAARTHGLSDSILIKERANRYAIVHLRVRPILLEISAKVYTLLDRDNLPGTRLRSHEPTAVCLGPTGLKRETSDDEG